MGEAARRSKSALGKPCSCDSGLNYDECCMLKGIAPPRQRELPREVLTAWAMMQAHTEFLHSKGIYIGLPNTATFKGKSFLAAGNKLMYDDNPHATFHELILRNLSLTLGKEWWSVEEKKSAAERHYVMQCFDELKGLFKDLPERYDLEATQHDEHLNSMRATGNTQVLLSLAFDVYLLTHKGYLPDEWLRRLKDRNEYQGVRYEIGVASMFVRMGCELSFYNPNEKTNDGRRPKRAEFIAEHRESGNRVAVEAKSRRHDGVIHQGGTQNLEKAAHGNINHLYKQALAKETDGLPLFIFIDVNAPIKEDEKADESKWFSDIRRSFESKPEPTPENPDKHTALFVTNYSSHYQGKNVAHSGQFLFIGSLYPLVPLSDGVQGMFMQKLIQAVTGYGYVPSDMQTPVLSDRAFKDQKAFQEDVIHA